MNHLWPHSQIATLLNGIVNSTGVIICSAGYNVSSLIPGKINSTLGLLQQQPCARSARQYISAAGPLTKPSWHERLKKCEWNPAIHKNRLLSRSDWRKRRSYIIHELQGAYWLLCLRTGALDQSALVSACRELTEKRRGHWEKDQSSFVGRGRLTTMFAGWFVDILDFSSETEELRAQTAGNFIYLFRQRSSRNLTVVLYVLFFFQDVFFLPYFPLSSFWKRNAILM